MSSEPARKEVGRGDMLQQGTPLAQTRRHPATDLVTVPMGPVTNNLCVSRWSALGRTIER
jgi:hypothetical protein